MKNLHKTVAILLVLSMMVFSSCEKDRITSVDTTIFYTLEIEGNEVKFTNESEGAATYKWEFGDGETSTDASPTHIYPGKGKYIATLFATTGTGTEEVSTVVRIDKSSPVKLNDNTLADWDAVTQYQITSGAAGGAFRKAKYDYDGRFLYCYFEIAGRKSADADIFDFYLDTDNNAATGLLSGYFLNGAYDVLLEGSLLTAGMDVFNHVGAQTAFSFSQQSVSDYLTVGTVTETGGILKFECRIERSKIKGLTGKGLKLGVALTKNDYSVEYGTSPDKGTDALFINLDE